MSQTVLSWMSRSHSKQQQQQQQQRKKWNQIENISCELLAVSVRRPYLISLHSIFRFFLYSNVEFVFVLLGGALENLQTQTQSLTNCANNKLCPWPRPWWWWWPHHPIQYIIVCLCAGATFMKLCAQMYVYGDGVFVCVLVRIDRPMCLWGKKWRTIFCVFFYYYRISLYVGTHCWLLLLLPWRWSRRCRWRIVLITNFTHDLCG